MVHASIDDISEELYNRLKKKTMAKKKKKKESTKNDNSFLEWKNSKR